MTRARGVRGSVRVAPGRAEACARGRLARGSTLGGCTGCSLQGDFVEAMPMDSWRTHLYLRWRGFTSSMLRL
eukprot:522318-Prymnesium_polylepis.2